MSIHSFSSKYLLNIYYVPGTTQGSWDISVSQTDKDPGPYGVYILVGRGGCRQQATDTADK